MRICVQMKLIKYIDYLGKQGERKTRILRQLKKKIFKIDVIKAKNIVFI